MLLTLPPEVLNKVRDGEVEECIQSIMSKNAKRYTRKQGRARSLVSLLWLSSEGNRDFCLIFL